MSDQATPPAPAAGRSVLLGPWAAAAVLGLFWALMLASLREKSLTFDEVGYAAAGYASWHFHDYRLQPESGQLPQRLIAAPLALGDYKFPSTDAPTWRDSRFVELGTEWFYHLGNDAAAMATRGRGAAGLFAVALGALVWAWSRRLFGPAGGMLSLLLYVLSPTVLANGALMTSDMAVALFFCAALGALWRLMQWISAGRLILSAGLIGALVLAKISALLICPMALLLVAARLADGRALPVTIGRTRELTRRWPQAAALGLAAAFHVVVVIAMVWAAYDFRYSAFAGTRDQHGRFALPWQYILGEPGPVDLLQQAKLTPEQDAQAQRIFQRHGLTSSLWINPALDAMDEIDRTVLTTSQRIKLAELRAKPSPKLTGRFLEFLRQHELMPEAWIYGLGDVLQRSQWRAAFFNGDFSMVGWGWFFPYTFAVKTPLAVFGVIALAIGALLASWREANCAGTSATKWRTWLSPGLYQTMPLWALLAVYCAVTLTSHLNIGHRHLLPLYGPLFVLCGIAGRWFETVSAPGAARRIPAFALAGLMGILAVDVLARFPNYLAYFNGFVRPAQAYRHLVDSSLDWGQDLPGVKHYIDAQPGRGPFYLSYFGVADPGYYGITARPLFSFFGLHLQGQPAMAIIPLPSDQPEQAAAALQQRRPEYDLLTISRFPNQVISVWLKKPAELRLTGGTYLISASMLQPVYYDLDGPWGPWNARHETDYQQLLAEVRPLLSDDLRERTMALNRHAPGEWPALLQQFEIYRLARLTAWLRQREADDTINYSIMVYRLSDADVARALEGPPPALGADLAAGFLATESGGKK